MEYPKNFESKLPKNIPNGPLRYVLSILILLIAVFAISGVISTRKVMAGTCGYQQASNSNGTVHVTYDCRLCTDPNSGLLVTYIIYYPFTWTTPDGVIHPFDVSTIHNTSNNNGTVLCGPDDSPSASGFATDGSGFTITVNSYIYETIYDSTGKRVYP